MTIRASYGWVSAGLLLLSAVAASGPRPSELISVPRAIYLPPPPSMGDACTALSSPTNLTITTYDNLMSCFQSFPVTHEERMTQITALMSYFAVYPFLNLAKSSNPPLHPSRIDIIALLKTLTVPTPTTPSLYNFHITIQNVLTRLNDPHISYHPSCFGGVAHMLPWVLAVKDGGGRPVIYVKEGTSRNSDFAMDRDEGFKGKMERFWEGIGVNVTEVLGWSVDEIDGVDAVTAIQTLADASGMSKDPISRFNFMLSRYTWRDGIRSLDGLSYVRPAHLIHSSTVTYRFRSPLNVFKEVTVPFASILEGAGVHRILGKGSVAYYNTFCGAREDTFVRRDGGGTRNESVGRYGGGWVGEVRRDVGETFWERIGVDDEEIEAAMETYEPMRNFEETRKGDAVFPVKQLQAISTIIRDDEYTPISTYPNGATFKLNENTGVWMFSAITPYSKRPNQTRLETHVNLLSDVMASLLELQRLNVTRLIIDVSNNEGGIVCLGMAIAQGLFPQTPLPPLNYTFRALSPLRLLANGTQNPLSPFFTRKLRNGRDERVVSSEEIFSPGTRRWVGGVAEDLTNRFHLNCTGYKAVARTGRWWKMLERSFEGVAVVSNGLCGSTCGTFVRALQHFHKVRTYTYSPMTPYPYQPTSYEGGTVVSLSDLHTSIQTDNLTSITGSTLFRPFPFATNGKIPFYQLEQPGRSEPAEWVPIRADAHVGEIEAGRVWRGVAKREGWM